MKRLLKNKIVLITGASGSIGSNLVIKLLKHYKCKVIRAMSNDENGLHELLENVDNNFKSFNLQIRMKRNNLRILYGDVRDYSRCLTATRNVDIVIHAAAMKHVSICEYNPEETIKTNVIGTKNIIKAAIKNKVKKIIFVSTDKAVNPTNDLGASKLRAEQISLASNFLKNNGRTKISCVRFGNIIGSRGSVLPRFINQITSKQEIKISSEKMSRYVMTIDDATHLVLKSLRIMKGGEIFIFKSMYSLKIIDLANCLKNYYQAVYKQIKIKIIGVSNKEKFSEELMTTEELKYSKETNDMYILNYKNLNKKTKKNRFKSTKLACIDSRYGKFLTIEQILKFLIKNNLLKKLL